MELTDGLSSVQRPCSTSAPMRIFVRHELYEHCERSGAFLVGTLGHAQRYSLRTPFVAMCEHTLDTTLFDGRGPHAEWRLLRPRLLLRQRRGWRCRVRWTRHGNTRGGCGSARWAYRSRSPRNLSQIPVQLRIPDEFPLEIGRAALIDTNGSLLFLAGHTNYGAPEDGAVHGRQVAQWSRLRRTRYS
jgi:hypothetical protein